MRIIEYGNFPRRRARISGGNGKLRRARTKPCKEQEKDLGKEHRLELNNRHWQYGKTGKGGEEKDDNRRTFSSIAKIAYERISKPCAQAAQNADEGRDSGLRGEGGLNHEQRAEERHGDKQPVFPACLFP